MSTTINLDEVLESAHLLPCLPEVAQKLLTNSSNLDFAKLAEIISRDAVISGRMLRMANSPYYGHRRKVTSIMEGATILGISRLRSLAIVSSTVSMDIRLKNFDNQLFWTRSIQVSCLNRWLALQCNLNQEVAFISGLFHGIGELLLRIVDPQYSEIDDAVKAGAQRLENETERYGFSQSDLSKALAERWNFPLDVSDVLGRFAKPGQLTAVTALAHTLYFSYTLCQGDLFINAEQSTELPATLSDSPLLTLLKIDNSNFFANLDKPREEAHSLINTI